MVPNLNDYNINKHKEAPKLGKIQTLLNGKWGVFFWVIEGFFGSLMNGVHLLTMGFDCDIMIL